MVLTDVDVDAVALSIAGFSASGGQNNNAVQENNAPSLMTREK